MDKYLIKKPREHKQEKTKSGKNKHMKQSTIESLQKEGRVCIYCVTRQEKITTVAKRHKADNSSQKLIGQVALRGKINTSPETDIVQGFAFEGVVVIEDILRLKSKLQLDTTSQEEMVETLNKLGQKIPPRHVMMDTKIGKLVNKLRKHEDSSIRRAAGKVYIKWKGHFVNHAERPLIEVTCDSKTETMRSSGRRLLAGALSLEENDTLPDAIERETFYTFKRLISHNYRRTMRTLVFTLKHNQEVKQKVISGEIKVPEFVLTYKK